MCVCAGEVSSTYIDAVRRVKSLEDANLELSTRLAMLESKLAQSSGGPQHPSGAI